jgi:MFS family permease
LASAPLWQVCDDVASSYYLTANTILSTVYGCSALFTPFLGSMTDIFGLKAALNVLAASSITGVHATLAFTTIYPVAPLVFLGLSYALYAAVLWPCIAIVTPQKDHATAYGLVTALQNLGQAVAPLGVAYLMPSARCSTFDTCVASWNQVEKLFVIIGVVGVLCGIALNIVDTCISSAPLLNESHAAMKRRLAKEENEKNNGAEMTSVQE